MAPPQLESFTHGGVGPQHAAVDLGDNEKDKAGRPLPLRCWNAARQCCRRCTPPSHDPPHAAAGTTTAIAMNDGVYYIDHFNDLSYACSVGTSDDDGVWINRSDPAGTIMSCLVWFLIGYSNLTMTFLAQTGGIPVAASVLYGILSSLALATHAKTSLTDPGSVPASAVPTEEQRRRQNAKLSMCSQCQTFKPPGSHHCRICNRCISKMDHQYVVCCCCCILLEFCCHFVGIFCTGFCYFLTSSVCSNAVVDSCPWMNSKLLASCIRLIQFIIVVPVCSHVLLGCESIAHKNKTASEREI